MNKWIMTVAGLLMIGSSSVAQELDSLRMINLQEVQVVSTRAGKKTPMAFTTLNKEEIKKQNYGQDIPFLLTLTPSVVATSDAGAGVGYTGVRIRGTDATRINITANGVPMNDADSHSLFWVNMPDFASSLEDIQVQRGVGSSTNGAGAFGGSINMKTESVASTPYGEVGGSYGSFNTHKEYIKIGTGLLKDHWSFDARLSNIGSDGYIDRASSDLKSYFFQAGYYNANSIVKFITFAGKEKTYHAWNGLPSDKLNSDRRYNSCGEIEDDKGNVIGFYDDQNDNYKQTNYQLLFTQQFTPQLNMNITFHYTDGSGYYQEYKNRRTLQEYGLEPFIVNGEKIKKSNLIRRKQMENNFGGAIFSLNHSSNKLTTSIGGGANKYVGDHFGRVIWVKNYIGDLAPDHEYYRTKTDKVDANIYAKAGYEIIDGLNLYGDMQYRHISYALNGVNDKWDYTGEGEMQKLAIDNKYNFFNPKVGLFYQLNRNNSAYASFSVAHKEPTRNNFTDAKFDVKPMAEMLHDYEAGYTFTNGTFFAGVNLYYMKYKDQLILTGEVNDIGEPLAANVPDSYRMGMEVQVGAKITEWLKWNGNVSWSRNRVKNYTEVLYDENYNKIENYIGSTNISFSPDIILNSLFTFELKGWNANLQSSFVGKQNMDNTSRKSSELGSYFVNNLRMGYTFPVKGIKAVSLNLLINNLLNASYESNGFVYSYISDNERYDDRSYFPQAGINVLANVSFRF